MTDTSLQLLSDIADTFPDNHINPSHALPILDFDYAIQQYIINFCNNYQCQYHSLYMPGQTTLTSVAITAVNVQTITIKQEIIHIILCFKCQELITESVKVYENDTKEIRALRVIAHIQRNSLKKYKRTDVPCAACGFNSTILCKLKYGYDKSTFDLIEIYLCHNCQDYTDDIQVIDRIEEWNTISSEKSTLLAVVNSINNNRQKYDQIHYKKYIRMHYYKQL